MKEESNDWRRILKKILRALRSVLLSMFRMDYQVELQEMKVSRFKLIFIVLTTATVIWAAFCYTSWGYISIGITLLVGWTGFILFWLTRSKGRKKTKR
ncbi:hypothetical protein KAU30_00190 [Candidatus Bathyarchaeota archaeon]|nr:hypothetical protein [Candidatus Bathyarchaeota archaeon]